MVGKAYLTHILEFFHTQASGLSKTLQFSNMEPYERVEEQE
jgi:hypothetical protein